MMVDLPLGFLSDFTDALDFIFNTREAQTGGVEVGGLAEVLEFTWEHLKVSGAAIGVACAVAIPAGLVLGHAGKGRFRDMRRDNTHVLLGRMTLRYGHADVLAHPCAMAWEVADLLVRYGWGGLPTRCRRCARSPRQ